MEDTDVDGALSISASERTDDDAAPTYIAHPCNCPRCSDPPLSCVRFPVSVPHPDRNSLCRHRRQDEVLSHSSSPRSGEKRLPNMLRSTKLWMYRLDVKRHLRNLPKHLSTSGGMKWWEHTACGSVENVQDCIWGRSGHIGQRRLAW